MTLGWWAVACLAFRFAGPDMLSVFIRGRAEASIASLRREVAALREPSDWVTMKRRLMRAYRVALGPFPKRTPLNARITGTLSLRGLVVEKVVFESQPKFYVTANLFLPQPRRPGRQPAVLILSGHYEQGKADPASPHRLLAETLARGGVAALVVDPLGQGERKLILDSERESTESCVTEHCMMGYPCLLTGTNLLQYLVWDAIRAIDYLCGRPEVDAKRIAVTGISGGGTQTFSLAPLDERVAFAAPTCFVTSRLAFLGNAADVEQCLHGAISHGLDHSMMIALCAPRAYQVQATRGDMFPIRGVRDSVDLARKVYRLLGVEDRLTLAEDDGGHEYTAVLRKSFYHELAHRFGLQADSFLELPLEPLAANALDCTPTGNVKTSFPDAHWVTDFNAERLAAPRGGRAAILTVLGPSVLAGRRAPPMARVVEVRRENGFVESTLALESEPGIATTCVVRRKDDALPRPATLFVGDGGWGGLPAPLEASPTAMVKRLADEGQVAMSVEVRGAYPAPRTIWDRVVGGEATAVQDLNMCGTSLFAGRVRDVLRAFDYLVARSDVRSHEVGVMGVGQGGLLALYAAALEKRVASCVVGGSLTTYRCLVGQTRFMHPPSTFLWNVLNAYDLPDVAACVAPRPLAILAPTDAMQRPVPEAEAHAQYRAAFAAYHALGADSRIQIVCGPGVVWPPGAAGNPQVH